MSRNDPFFLLGSVRSGTTLLRDILRQHPRLAAPEETQFFRWAEPYGSRPYEQKYLGDPLFQQHRKLDGVGEFDFFYSLQHGRHRKDLMDNYARIYLEKNALTGKRWFDKSPQNVYGLMMLSAMYPSAKFVHIHRHPYNVVASLRAGLMIERQSIRGAINYWLESAMIINEYKKGFPRRIHQLAYRDLCDKPLQTVNAVLKFLKEKPMTQFPESIVVGDEQNRFLDILEPDDIDYIHNCCGDMLRVYGYDD